MRIRLYQVDAFASRVFAGNPDLIPSPISGSYDRDIARRAKKEFCGG